MSELKKYDRIIALFVFAFIFIASLTGIIVSLQQSSILTSLAGQEKSVAMGKVAIHLVFNIILLVESSFALYRNLTRDDKSLVNIVFLLNILTTSSVYVGSLHAFTLNSASADVLKMMPTEVIVGIVLGFTALAVVLTATGFYAMGNKTVTGILGIIGALLLAIAFIINASITEFLVMNPSTAIISAIHNSLFAIAFVGASFLLPIYLFMARKTETQSQPKIVLKGHKKKRK